jgi:hypothetical protein
MLSQRQVDPAGTPQRGIHGPIPHGAGSRVGLEVCSPMSGCCTEVLILKVCLGEFP